MMKHLRRFIICFVLQKKTNLNLSDEIMEFYDRLNLFHIESRYPDFKSDLEQTCTEEFTKKFLQSIKEHFQWLKLSLK